MLIFATLFAGLGLLFIGLRLMGSHLQQAMGRRVRKTLKAATRSSLTGLACGAFAGAVAQSSNAVTLIAGNLVRGGVLTTRDAIPVVAGANVGTAALVFVAAIDLRAAVLYLLAMVGLGFQLKLDRSPTQREWMGVLLGLALLFLGLDYIKAAPKGLTVDQAASLLSGITPLMGLAIGFLAATITQSASTATILAVAAVQGQLLGLEDSFFMILGANFGSGIATLISAGGLKGTGKQLCVVHILVKGIGCVVVYLLWLGASLSGFNSAAILDSLGRHQTTLSISVVFLVLQLSGGLVVTCLAGTTERIANWFSPPTREDHVSRPHFIQDDALGDPASALQLAARETERLMRHLPDMLPDLDQMQAGEREVRVVSRRGAATISAATEQFMLELLNRHLDREDLDLALRIQAQLDLCEALRETLWDFADLVVSFKIMPPLAFNLSESLRMIIALLADAPRGDREDIDTLLLLTGDRGELMDRYRRELASSIASGGEDARRLQAATSLFERAVWLARRLALTLRYAENEDKSSLQSKPANQEEAHAD
ncbi:MAG: hypothetical protein B7Z15_11245 [Rhizobiales bacterium 32-66-8]|nr:MAG: hypothetical protein B7Z15_11245 [Rhizobiales bacterium 32-66-8]